MVHLIELACTAWLIFFALSLVYLLFAWIGAGIKDALAPRRQPPRDWQEEDARITAEVEAFLADYTRPQRRPSGATTPNSEAIT